MKDKSEYDDILDTLSSLITRAEESNFRIRVDPSEAGHTYNVGRWEKMNGIDETENDINCWRIIEFADWKNCKDYKIIGNNMRLVFKQEVLKQVKNFYSEKLKEIEEVLNNYAATQPKGRRSFWGLGDDSFWDLRAHIIGLGENFYLRVLNDPSIAKEMADKGDFKENFGYIFNYMELDKEEE